MTNPIDNAILRNQKFMLKYDGDVYHMRIKRQYYHSILLYHPFAWQYDALDTYLASLSMPYGQRGWASAFIKHKLTLLPNMTGAEDEAMKQIWLGHGLTLELWNEIEFYLTCLFLKHMPSFVRVLFKEEFEDKNIPSFTNILFKEEFEDKNIPSLTNLLFKEEVE